VYPKKEKATPIAVWPYYQRRGSRVARSRLDCFVFLYGREKVRSFGCTGPIPLPVFSLRAPALVRVGFFIGLISSNNSCRSNHSLIKAKAFCRARASRRASR